MKILFTDLDGTLLNKESTVSEYTKSVLRSWVEAGNLLVPNSGRTHSSIIQVLESAGITDLVTYVIGYNGAVIWNKDENKPAWEAKLPLEIAAYVQDQAKLLGIHAHTYHDEVIITPADDEETRYYTRLIHRPVTVVDEPMSYVNSDVYKYLAINLHNRELLLKLQDIVLSKYGKDVDVLFSNPYYLEFFNRRAGKGNAVIELCKLLNVDISDAYAAGDEENDISMIKAAGHGIAMKNATTPVLEIADVVTSYDNGDDGLARFIADIC